MKRLPLFFALVLISLFLLPACHKDNGGGTQSSVGNPVDSIRNHITQTMLDSLKKFGMHIYDGKTPPIVAGIYHLDRDSCVFDNVPKTDTPLYEQGRIIDSYKYRFSKQDNATQTIRFDRKDDNGLDAASNSLGYITGSDNNFTIFSFESVTGGPSPHTEVKIISGQVSPAGIANFQSGLYLLTTQDPSHSVPVGTIRVFVDEDGVADATTVYSIKPPAQSRTYKESFLE